MIHRKNSLTALLAATLGGISSLATPLSAALLAHYSFDSASFTDGSGNENHLTVGGGTPNFTSTAGEFVFGTGAVNFAQASAEYLKPTTNFSFTFSAEWSVSFWARRRPGTAAATGMVLGDNTTTDSFIWLPDNSAQVQGLRFRPVGVGTSVNYDYSTGHDTNFHHWVMVADGSGTIRVYRDNVDRGTRAVAGGTDFLINAIGSGYTGTAQMFDGQIDELYIFNEAINSTTVGSLFTSNAIPEPGSIALLGLGGLLALRRRR